MVRGALCNCEPGTPGARAGAAPSGVPNWGKTGIDAVMAGGGMPGWATGIMTTPCGVITGTIAGCIPGTVDDVIDGPP